MRKKPNNSTERHYLTTKGDDATRIKHGIEKHDGNGGSIFSGPEFPSSWLRPAFFDHAGLNLSNSFKQELQEKAEDKAASIHASTSGTYARSDRNALQWQLIKAIDRYGITTGDLPEDIKRGIESAKSFSDTLPNITLS